MSKSPWDNNENRVKTYKFMGLHPGKREGNMEEMDREFPTSITWTFSYVWDPSSSTICSTCDPIVFFILIRWFGSPYFHFNQQATSAMAAPKEVSGRCCCRISCVWKLSSQSRQESSTHMPVTQLQRLAYGLSKFLGLRYGSHSHKDNFKEALRSKDPFDSSEKNVEWARDDDLWVQRWEPGRLHPSVKCASSMFPLCRPRLKSPSVHSRHRAALNNFNFLW